jgi:Uma2 family endonuclease
MATGQEEVRFATALLSDREVRVPATAFDLDGFRRWVQSDSCDERSRCSFMAGEVFVEISPEEIESHNKPKNYIGYGLTHWVNQHEFGKVLADGALLVNEAASLSTEPDIMFCSWDRLRSGQVRYAEAVKGSNRFVEVHGSPDIVVEIVSASSVRKDTERLHELYYRADVAEYWLIDARGEEVQFHLFGRGHSQWAPTPADRDGFVASQVLGGSFAIERDLNPVGGYRYTLASK